MAGSINERTLLRGSATENPTYGVLCERRKCGPHHLLHLPEIQSGMEKPAPSTYLHKLLDVTLLWIVLEDLHT